MEKRLIDANDARKRSTHDIITHFLDRCPTVDAVEVVHARWENVSNGKGCCSNCHKLDSIDKLATHCRYCGAKMDGGNEDG